MPEWNNKTIGNVRVDKELARGGMGEVYVGTHLRLDRLVIVKVMHSYIESDPELQARFEREAKVVAALRHPNIVQVFDFDIAEGHPYIVMEYLRGPSLASYLRELNSRNEKLQPAQIARLLSITAAALEYAHEQGVIHRDIKPANIILHNKTGLFSSDLPLSPLTEPVITDFGLVRIHATTQTSVGKRSGTPAYMSPEQSHGLTVDHRSDIYSLGIVLYELIAGHVPFDAETNWGILFKHINEPPPPIPDITPPVQNVIDRALAKDPDARYQTCRDLAADYMEAIGMVSEADAVRAGTSFPVTRQPAPVVASDPRAQPERRTWKRAAVYSLAGLLLLSLAIWGFLTFVSPGLLAGPGVIPHAGEEARVGLLRFQDGTAPADQVTISTSSMEVPPQGSQYEAWLIQDDGEQRLSLGVIAFDQQNQGSLAFLDSAGQNLLGKYRTLEITREPVPDPSPNSSNDIAFSVSLPPDALTHLRHLLFSFNGTPQKIGFVRGLDADTLLLNESAQQMLASLEARDEAGVDLHAERMLNLILGSQSEEYKDWNEDGTVDDPGDGYGLLLNGENLGYIQGTFTHADLSLTSPNATQNILTHGKHVKDCATNLDGWTAQLRDQLRAIQNAPFDSPETEGRIREAVALADKIRNGIDVNGNEKIEPVPGEGGAVTAYEHTYYMADMVIIPSTSQSP
ncbi:MAG TPA: serine/threonine-protein kinase [Anaerolineales bacterium]|nr:serine/threonine-protein kinase [Anaerolineales bacterium]